MRYVIQAIKTVTMDVLRVLRVKYLLDPLKMKRSSGGHTYKHTTCVLASSLSSSTSRMSKTPQNPVIIAMKGHPGTGKTTLAHALASTLRIPLLDKDDIRDATVALRNSSGPSSLLSDLSYDAIFRLAATQIRLGLSVVVDSPLSRRRRLDGLLRSAAGARVLIVECRPSDEDKWRRRLETRGGRMADEHKPLTWRDLQRLLESYDGCTDYDVGDVPRLVVDTTADEQFQEVVSRVVDFILSYSD